MSEPDMIDAHHHLWNYSTQEYPWIPEGSALAQSYGLAELHEVTARSGVTGTVVVQARQSIEETRWLLSLAAKSPVIRGVVGWLPLIEETIAEQLDQWQHEEALKGLRHVLQEEPDEYFARADFHRGLAALAQTHLRYDLLIFERQIPAALAMIDQHPQLPIIIDHIAKPEIHNGRISETWRAGMRELSQRDQVIGVKISGMATEVRDETLCFDTLRAYFDETLEIFGAQRIMLGSDWPVSLLRLESYPQWIHLLRSFINRLSEADQQLILTDNAIRCYGL
jgi:L-fuconolactonase